MKQKQYIAIDLKSFYASVECVDRGLEPLETNLVVADESRTEKTICLAVSPPLKEYGIPGRARLFEVNQRVREVNAVRLTNAPAGKLTGGSHFKFFLDRYPNMALEFIIAPPRMARYMEVSAAIYQIYLRYIAPEDIHVYSIDEVFIDATDYLKTYGITATAGIGTNLYLAKIAMDIDAKHIKADRDGVRIAELDEMSFRERLWSHRPLTDFWRIGRGISARLERYGMLTMGDVARCSVQNEKLLYSLFGKNAELLIDHAWGWEPCTMKEIKSYTPANTSVSVGQVLPKPYPFEKARLIVREMAEQLALDLVRKRLVTDQVVLTVGYDISSAKGYEGELAADFYGRIAPKRAHGSENLGSFTSSGRIFVEAMVRLFERITDPDLMVRRMYVVANHTISEEQARQSAAARQLSLFELIKPKAEAVREQKEKDIQYAILQLQNRYGKNAVLKGMNLCKGATAIERNSTIGGHKA